MAAVTDRNKLTRSYSVLTPTWGNIMKSFFVSSTFSDMQAERDILHQRVFPRIRKQLEPYGEDIEGLDLRWGVDTSNMSEKESGKHVVKICIDTIDRCKPYMIILIGERYGWIYEIFQC